MNLEQRIQAFCKLGEFLSHACDTKSPELYTYIQKAHFQNQWFTHENCVMAVQALTNTLIYEKLHAWIHSYTIPHKIPARIAVIMAGNIPLVGFHDALCVLISGNTLIAKVSSKDTVLIEYVLSKLIEIEQRFEQNIQICTQKLPKFDAIICTGSNNSSRYFEYYFGKYPHIIRKNRNSVGVITQDDTPDIYPLFFHDVFAYFGLGCRNISKIYIHKNHDIRNILDACKSYEFLTQHAKYMNNYEYQKSLYLLNQQEHLDTGYLLLTQSTQLHSPLAVLFYETYTHIHEVQKTVELEKDVLQCIVCSNNIFYKENTKPGTTQMPELYNYADDIDTLSFILNLPV